MKLVLQALSLILIGSGTANAKVLHDEISQVFRGTWAPTLKDCADPDGVNVFVIDGESVNYYEANDYLLLGIEFGGAMTKGDGSGALFNGRFTSRMETKLIGESNIRFEIDDENKNVLYRYPIGDDGEPIVTREVKDVRCPLKP